MILKDVRFLVTQNSNREVKENVDVLIEDKRIQKISENLNQEEREVIDCSDKIVMPGLINAHTHAPMALLRGISDNKELQDWLEEDIFPAEDEMTPEDIYLGTLLASVEMLETGTTCFNDMYGEPDEIIKAVEEAGIRAVVSRGLFDWDDKGEERIKEAKEMVEKYKGHQLVTPAVAPHAVYTCSLELLKEMKIFSEEHQVPYHIHVSETEKENEDLMDEEGLSPTEYLNENDLLDSSVVAAHAAWLSEEDKRLFEEKGANVAHNPAANLKLGSGIAEIPELMDKGVNVALGTDGPASNNNFNLFEEMKTASLVHKVEDPTRMDEQKVLDMATINGAKALGLEDEIGSIEEGKKADLLIIDLSDSELKPFYGESGLVSNLVYSFTGSPDRVMVDGQWVVNEKEINGINKSELLEEAQEKVCKFENATK